MYILLFFLKLVNNLKVYSGFNLLINWLFSPSRTEINLAYKFYIINYYSALLKESVRYSRKNLESFLINHNLNSKRKIKSKSKSHNFNFKRKY